MPFLAYWGSIWGSYDRKLYYRKILSRESVHVMYGSQLEMFDVM